MSTVGPSGGGVAAVIIGVLSCDLEARCVTRNTRELRTLAKSDVSFTVFGSPLALMYCTAIVSSWPASQVPGVRSAPRFERHSVTIACFNSVGPTADIGTASWYEIPPSSSTLTFQVFPIVKGVLLNALGGGVSASQAEDSIEQHAIPPTISSSADTTFELVRIVVP